MTRDDVMTADQVADLLHLKRSTVEDYARRDILPSIKLGRHRRFLRDDVLAAIDALRGEAQTANVIAIRRHARRRAS